MKTFNLNEMNITNVEQVLHEYQGSISFSLNESF